LQPEANSRPQARYRTKGLAVDRRSTCDSNLADSILELRLTPDNSQRVERIEPLQAKRESPDQQANWIAQTSVMPLSQGLVVRANESQAIRAF
jgi:hypothetical protein